jgi:hypothetical protein
MNQTRHDKTTYAEKYGGEVGLLSNRLTALRQADERWAFNIHARDSDGILSRVFWINPYQRTLAALYGDVVILDVSEGRNVFDYHLTTFVVIDGENNSRNIGFCLTEKQDHETFEWMLNQMRPFLTRLTAIMTDRAPQMASAILVVFPHVFHCICRWHLLRNLTENLSSKLRSNFKLFLRNFGEVYLYGSPRSFEVGWNRLLIRWPEAAPYLRAKVYAEREKVHDMLWSC